MSKENVERVERALAASNSGDAEALIAESDPGFEMHLVGVAGEPVFYTGASGIRQFFRDMAESWETFRFEASDVRDLGDSVLALGTVKARGRASGIDVEAPRAYIVEFVSGKATSMRGFHNHQKALEATGLDA
jgi:ketosteroid isomerase-like protein